MAVIESALLVLVVPSLLQCLADALWLWNRAATKLVNAIKHLCSTCCGSAVAKPHSSGAVDAVSICMYMGHAFKAVL
jgi:hypothetical protein